MSSYLKNFIKPLTLTISKGQTWQCRLWWTLHELYDQCRNYQLTLPIYMFAVVCQPINMCCLAQVSSVITMILPFNQLDFLFWSIPWFSWLKPHLCWHYIRGNDKVGTVNLSCRSQVCELRMGTSLNKVFQLSIFYELHTVRNDLQATFK